MQSLALRGSAKGDSPTGCRPIKRNIIILPLLAGEEWGEVNKI